MSFFMFNAVFVMCCSYLCVFVLMCFGVGMWSGFCLLFVIV